jgi:all-trans-retinol dehydrogenase (NAD+)
MRTLRKKRVLITGGAQGMGREMALAFADEGAQIALADINQEKLEKTREEVQSRGVPCRAFGMDVTDERSILKARDDIKRDIGSVDVLVNNAGVVFGGPFLDTPLEKHFATYRVNILGVVAVTHAFLPILIDRPSAHLVTIASASGLIGLPDGSTYASSKWAAIGFSESIRLELKLHGHSHVKVTTVCPSYIGTGMFEGARPPKLTAMLDPAKLARRIVKAVKKEEILVLEPWLVKVTPIIRGVLPPILSDLVSDLFGATSSMEQWKGHQ